MMGNYQVYENHWTIYLKGINIMVYELFLNESYVTGSQGMHILGLYRFCHQYGF